MKDKLLKLAKRLNRFTLADIEPILCCDNLENILQELVSENLLKFSNGNYFYVKKSELKKELPNFFQFHTQDEIDMIIKCFCADIPALKTTLLIESSKTVTCNFYKFFRETIYKAQFKELKDYFDNNPKSPAIRAIYSKKVYMYYYNKKVYVAEKPLKSSFEIKKHEEVEMRKIRNSYYKVRRHFLNYSLQKVLVEVVVERLWRQDKRFDELVYELNVINKKVSKPEFK